MPTPDLQKPVLIVNPRAGQGAGASAWARLVGPITDQLGPFDVRFTERAGHATAIAAEETARGRALVVALGGDGTINEVANGLLSGRVEAGPARTALGIIPRGTGGDFRRTLGLPMEIGKAAAHLRTAPARVVDVGHVTLTGHDGTRTERHFVNVASFGFSAAVADRANRSSKRLGARAAFLGATLKTLATYDNVEVLVSVDEAEPVRRKVLFGALGNGCFFGGGMKVCPGARLDSGSLELVLVGDLGRFTVMLKTNRLYDGTHLAMPEVTQQLVRTVTVTPADPEQTVLVEIDGETPGRLPATFTVIPGALTLRA